MNIDLEQDIQLQCTQSPPNHNQVIETFENVSVFINKIFINKIFR